MGENEKLNLLSKPRETFDFVKNLHYNLYTFVFEKYTELIAFQHLRKVSK